MGVERRLRKRSARPAACWRAGLLVLSALLAPVVSAAELKVAVAANFAPVLQELSDDFRTQTGHQLLLSGASSGTLYAQITNGAPYDVFLSADLQRPQALISAGQAVPDSGVIYARGALVLFAPKRELNVSLAEVLADPQLRFVAMANPRTAPYGKAAEQLIQAVEAQLPGSISAQRVVGSSVGQAFQYVMSGNAELGLVALSQLRALKPVPQASQWIVVDQDLYPPLEQGGVILRRSHQQNAAQAFIRFLMNEQTQQQIQTAGYLSLQRRVWP